ncbi:hypothetical protein [Zestomonas carbonaria]|uniref:FG-GAP repeat-containing protein n=1 Tax=Zestomonas carbonaria TaxID=2762745 RepID=A0A7U7ESY1_9GAMM|nr:hypothetical protein [Pseudomonas carbonaria]CAD5110568.1 hypothetical protein PSEWESI4_04891 [Pseudomonas carbonaria]
MKTNIPLLVLAALLASVAATAAQLSPQDEAAAFRAAGFKQQGQQWRLCDDPGTSSYTPGTIETVRDLNGDGRPEVVISEGSTFCHGMTGMGYSLVSQQADGSWKLMDSSTGIPSFLDTKGTDGWPDIEVGGPGFCFPVVRWNGREYALHRQQYQGKPCQH